MISGGDICQLGRRRRLLPAFALAGVLISAIAGPADAQMFSDRPPPVPPAAVPEPSGPAMNLAPPSGPASAPSLPPALTQPSLTHPPIAAVPPALAPQGAAVPGQAVLSLTARYGKDLPVIGNGLVWRVFGDKPDQTGTLQLGREGTGAR